MSLQTEPEIDYPEDDGLPMSDNTVQFRWIQLLHANLDSLYSNNPDVFVGGNLLWYPVRGNNVICRAPDTFVAFDRPKDDRSVYRQWDENDIPLTVVFEVRSPNDSNALMRAKLDFYNLYGSEEYYLIDPDRNRFNAYRRVRRRLSERPLQQLQSTSPRLGIRFDLSQGDIRVFLPDGSPFLTPAQMTARAERAEQRTEAERRRADADAARMARAMALMDRVMAGTATPAEVAEFQQLRSTGSPDPDSVN